MRDEATDYEISILLPSQSMKIMIPEEGFEFSRKIPPPSFHFPFFAHRSTFLFRPADFLQDINYFRGLQGLIGRKISDSG